MSLRHRDRRCFGSAMLEVGTYLPNHRIECIKNTYTAARRKKPIRDPFQYKDRSS